LSEALQAAGEELDDCAVCRNVYTKRTWMTENCALELAVLCAIPAKRQFGD
jgi:hypothetical protein